MNKCSGPKTYMSKLYIKSCSFPYPDCLLSRETDIGPRDDNCPDMKKGMH